MTAPTAEEQIGYVRLRAWFGNGDDRLADAVEFVAALCSPVESLFGLGGGALTEHLGTADGVADVLESFGMKRIGQPGPEGPNPATVGHQIAHSHAVLGFLASLATGALIALGATALVALTGPGAPVLLVAFGAAAATGFATEFVGHSLIGGFSQVGSRVGVIVRGSVNVLIAGRPAACVTHEALCTHHMTPPQPIVEGCKTVLINGLNLARVGHKLLCGSVIDEGVPSVIVDEATETIAEPASEIPAVLRIAAAIFDIHQNKPGPSKPDSPPSSKPPPAKDNSDGAAQPPQKSTPDKPPSSSPPKPKSNAPSAPSPGPTRQGEPQKLLPPGPPRPLLLPAPQKPGPDAPGPPQPPSASPDGPQKDPVE